MRGLDSVLLTTQNGSIILGGGISFQNIPNLFFYARGDNVALNLASPISGASNLLLNSEGTVQVNGNVSVTNFNAFSQGDFLDGSGIITAHDVTINSIGGNVTFNVSKFPDVAGGTLDLTANGTLTFIPITGPITRASIVGHGGTIDFVSSEPFTFDFSNSSVSFTAGEGGIQASNIDFVGPNLDPQFRRRHQPSRFACSAIRARRTASFRQHQCSRLDLSLGRDRDC